MTFYSQEGPLIHYHYADQGKDLTLVFIHSLGTDFRIWDEVVNTVIPNVNVLLFDLRGHGLSDVCPSANGLWDYCSDLMGLMDFLGIQKNCIPIGLSVGGMIAQILATRLPTAISKLILCDTGYKIGSHESWNDRIRKIKEAGLPAISAEVISRWFGASYKTNNPERVCGYINMLERNPLQGYIDTCAAIRDADISQIAEGINQPTLCLVGDEDISTTPEEVKKLSRLIKGSKFIIIEGSGHLPCLDNADKMASIILQFIFGPDR
jgi:3-oxoadipate enol-lactonase